MTRRGRPKPRLHWLMGRGRSTYDEMLAAVRSGAFAYIAAEMCGVTRRTFHNWLARGESDLDEAGDDATTSKLTIFARFYLDVMQAQARARFTAETNVHRDNPAAWLRMGPGREAWTDQQTIDVSIGGREDSPVVMEHRGGATHEVAPSGDLAETLRILQEAGALDALLGSTNGQADADEYLPRCAE